MDFLKEFRVPATICPISHEKEIIFLGSCFSENIAEKMALAGFRTLSNPFGTIFHPVPLAKFITDSLSPESTERLVLREDVHLSLDAAAAVYGMSEQELRETISAIRADFRNRLRSASTLIVTFGSAHGYTYLADRLIAANCHKLPGREFRKELTSTEQMQLVWDAALEQIRLHNPEIQVIFTVSPVRYKRDGWIENNRSKARLVELCAALENQAGYFPAYELVNDLLRDYRYFEKDGVHPNQLAIDEVWNLFSSWYFSASTARLADEVLRLRQMADHRFLHPESAASKRFAEQFESEKAAFLASNPQIAW